MCGGDVIPDFALDRHVRHEALIGFGIHPWKVSRIGVAVGIAVRHVEEQNEIVAVL